MEVSETPARSLAHMREPRFIQSPFEVRYLVAEKIEDILPMVETAAAKTAVQGAATRSCDRLIETKALV